MVEKCRRMIYLKFPQVVVVVIGCSSLTFMFLLLSPLFKQYFDESENIFSVQVFSSLADRVDEYCHNLDKRYYADAHLENESLLSRAKRAKLIRDALIYLSELNQMWCLVPKAGSTSWSKLLLQLTPTNPPSRKFESTNETKPLQLRLKQAFGYTNKLKYIDALRKEEVRKILIVRHPFGRIASAYRDKLENRHARPDSLYFYQHYGAMIIRKYRKDHRIKQREPTFLEFIDYLINTDPIYYDEHWEPISVLCGVCHVKYHVVIKMETMEKNWKEVLYQLNFPPSLSLPHENRVGGARGFIHRHSSASDYFTNVSRSKMVLLYRKYEMDFHIFNYSFLDYYQ